MRVCVIDGRGGGLGSRLVSGLRDTLHLDCQILALGTNLAAAAAMKEAGAEARRSRSRGDLQAGADGRCHCGLVEHGVAGCDVG